LADVIVPQGEAASVQQELLAWEQMLLANPPLSEVFHNPTVAYEQKQRVLNEVIQRTKVQRTTANFLRVLLKNQRLADLPSVNAKLTEVLDERSGFLSAQITSARPVAENTRAALEAKLRQFTGKSVRLTFDCDEALLGGIITRIGSTIYDGSVRTQLGRLGERLLG
jgi:F-type H+-transporting ATPase subunit delta